MPSDFPELDARSLLELFVLALQKQIDTSTISPPHLVRPAYPQHVTAGQLAHAYATAGLQVEVRGERVATFDFTAGLLSAGAGRPASYFNHAPIWTCADWDALEATVKSIRNWPIRYTTSEADLRVVAFVPHPAT